MTPVCIKFERTTTKNKQTTVTVLLVTKLFLKLTPSPTEMFRAVSFDRLSYETRE